jgi:hypothetical protein
VGYFYVEKGRKSLDKLAIGFMADILYLKGILCWEEFEEIQRITEPADLQKFVDKFIGGEFNVYKRGEIYTTANFGE